MADCESQLRNASMGLWLCELEKDPSTAQASSIATSFSAQDDAIPAWQSLESRLWPYSQLNISIDNLS
jgi:hypothetical protein